MAAGVPLTVPAEGSTDTAEESSAIDPSLSLEDAPSAGVPLPGTSYAGLTPAQRQAFLTWAHKPHTPAPAAFQQLYLANLEARLFEEDLRSSAFDMLQTLGASATWAKNIALHRAYLLACWLLQDGQRLAAWVSTQPLPAGLLGIAFGLQAQLDTPLDAGELGVALATWQLGAPLPADLLKLRLDSLTAILSQPPLAYALAQLDADSLTPRPWRTAHRGLRLSLPQPDLQPVLEPSLRDLLAVADVDATDRGPHSNLASLDAEPASHDEEVEQPSLEDLGWRLILEFGSNRSDYFDYVLMQAQKLPGYSQLMDEDRRIVYRVIFRKSEMRRFWRIWDYVNNWTTTRVYVNGNELEKWKVWPYSQYLK